MGSDLALSFGDSSCAGSECKVAPQTLVDAADCDGPVADIGGVVYDLAPSMKAGDSVAENQTKAFEAFDAEQAVAVYHSSHQAGHTASSWTSQGLIVCTGHSDAETAGSSVAVAWVEAC